MNNNMEDQGNGLSFQDLYTQNVRILLQMFCGYLWLLLLVGLIAACCLIYYKIYIIIFECITFPFIKLWKLSKKFKCIEKRNVISTTDDENISFRADDNNENGTVLSKASDNNENSNSNSSGTVVDIDKQNPDACFANVGIKIPGSSSESTKLDDPPSYRDIHHFEKVDIN